MEPFIIMSSNAIFCWSLSTLMSLLVNLASLFNCINIGILGKFLSIADPFLKWEEFYWENISLLMFKNGV
jgi:hypothetical protein